MFCSSELRGDVPLIVNDGLHKNLLESLALVSGTDRKIIALGMERAVHLEELLMTSCAGYVPFERRDARKPGHSHGRFSQIAFSVLRERFIPIAEELGIDRPPRSVYLKRGGAARQILNLDEVETTLLEAGFVTVRPEKLSFVEQVALFSSAEHIVGASGAAMANMIFCKPHARVSICIGIHPDTSYWYWQNMACAAGNSVNYILCRNRPSSNPTIHDDFTVDLSALKDAIQR
jgi:hypothetical protein